MFKKIFLIMLLAFVVQESLCAARKNFDASNPYECIVKGNLFDREQEEYSLRDIAREAQKQKVDPGVFLELLPGIRENVIGGAKPCDALNEALKGVSDLKTSERPIDGSVLMRQLLFFRRMGY